jgi:hypothetical protein
MLTAIKFPYGSKCWMVAVAVAVVVVKTMNRHQSE